MNSIRGKDLISKPGNILAFGFGSGLSSIAPGTVGTVVAIPIYLAIVSINELILPAVVLIALVVGIKICGDAAASLQTHDHPGIVWDEIVGYWITMLFIPVTFLSIAIGFLLFRFFDIVKPWPIKWADQKVSGGLGIMLDDVIAGIMANIVLQALILLNVISV